MILDRLSILFGRFGAPGRPNALSAARPMAKRWMLAVAREPELAVDLIQLSGLMTSSPVNMVDGVPEPASIDPYQLAYERGQQDFARLLLALCHLSAYDLNQLVEKEHDA